jgi:hypothetical protein
LQGTQCSCFVTWFQNFMHASYARSQNSQKRLLPSSYPSDLLHCLSTRSNSSPPWTDFHKNFYWRIFRESQENSQVSFFLILCDPTEDPHRMNTAPSYQVENVTPVVSAYLASHRKQIFSPRCHPGVPTTHIRYQYRALGDEISTSRRRLAYCIKLF